MTCAKQALSEGEGAIKKNSKHEIRNPKQIQMTKIDKTPNKLPSDSVFWIFFGFGFIWLRFVSDFVLRISDFVQSLFRSAGSLLIFGFRIFSSGGTPCD
jgi:hypothetical protein